MYNLTDRYGPRLTNSPQFRRAGDWAVGQLKEWGLSNVKLEKWATTGGRGGPIPSWEVTGYSGAMVEPTYMPLVGYPQAWSGSTNGPITGEAVLAQIQAPADLDKFHGKLKGKIVLTAAPPELAFPDQSAGPSLHGRGACRNWCPKCCPPAAVADAADGAARPTHSPHWRT